MPLEQPMPVHPLESRSTASYPVLFAIVRPEQFSRTHLLLRVVVFAVLSMMGISLGAAFCVLYFLLPVFSAAMLSQKGPVRFFAEDGPRLERALRWVMSLFAYLALLTDSLPSAQPDGPVRLEVQFEGRPAPKGALKRLVASVPSAIVLAVLSIALWLVWVVSAIMIVITGHYPESLYDFQCGVLRWQARLLAYHASLVDQAPPWTLDTGPEPAA